MPSSVPSTSSSSGKPSVTPSESSSTKLQGTVLSLIVALAVFLRVHAIATKSFWVDEGISAGIARLPWKQFFLVLWHREANMALYYLLLHFWMKLGSGEALVRGLSVVFSVATIPLMYSLGRRLFGNAAGLMAAWLLAINAYHIRYAQEARGYALVVLLTTLSTWLLVRNLQRPAAARWGAYALTSALAVYAHFFGALVVAAHVAAMLWLPREAAPWRGFGRSVRWFAYMVLPLAALAAKIGGGPVNWLPSPSLATVTNFFAVMTGNGGAALMVLDALALLLAAFFGWRAWRSAGSSKESWGYVLIFLWLLAPPAAVLFVSLVRPFFLARYLIFCLPALVLGVAAGVARLRPAALGWVLAAAISVFCAQGTRSYYRADFDLNREDWRSATGFILDSAKPGDAIFFTSLGRLPYDYYRTLRKPAPPGPWILNAPDGASLEYKDFLVIPLAEMLRDARPAPDRVWLVFFLNRMPSGEEDRTSLMLRAVYGKGRRLEEQQEFPQITVLLYTRDSVSR